jgi:hypothetical protein
VERTQRRVGDSDAASVQQCNLNGASASAATFHARGTAPSAHAWDEHLDSVVDVRRVERGWHVQIGVCSWLGRLGLARKIRKV